MSMVKSEEHGDIVTIEFEEPQAIEGDFHQNPSSNSNDAQSTSTLLPRSKPGRKSDQEREQELYQRREWTDDEIMHLIGLWKSNDVLYNTRHPMYYVQAERKKALERVIDELGISSKDVNDKMHSLRTYYCSQRQRCENSNSGHVSRWKFFNQMSFLYESVTNRANRNVSNRSTRKRYRYEDDYTMSRPVSQVHTYPSHYSPIYDDYNPHTPQDETQQNMPPSSSSSSSSKVENQSYKDNTKSQEFDDTASRTSNTEVSCSTSTNVCDTKSVSSADTMFLKMVESQLSQICEGQEKEKLKLDIQTMIFKTRFNTEEK